LEDPKNAKWREYERSQPEMMTALKRKQELREKVDVNFDGRIAFLEYLLHQYRDVANPADFCHRSMSGPDEHPEIRKARLALEEVNKRIRAYEAEKARLEAESKEPGVKVCLSSQGITILSLCEWGRLCFSLEAVWFRVCVQRTCWRRSTRALSRKSSTRH